MSAQAAYAPAQPLSYRSLIGPVLLADRFSLDRPMNIIRVMAGLWYIPHVMQKLNGIDASLAFFTRAGLTPAPLFLGLALFFEASCVVALTLGIFTRWIALASAGCMAVAAYAIIQTKGLHWTWALSGIEYLVFWGVASLAIALDAVQRDRG
jgi:putative oxidoreductase